MVIKAVLWVRKHTTSSGGREEDCDNHQENRGSSGPLLNSTAWPCVGMGERSREVSERQGDG